MSPLSNMIFHPALSRAAGGIFALVTAVVLSSPNYPHRPIPHADIWGILSAAALFLNVPAIIRYLRAAKHDSSWFYPLVDALLPFLTVCGITVVLTAKLFTDFTCLFGIWLMGLGLMNLALRHVLPAGIRGVGLYYMASGMLMLLIYPGTFFNPWPMASILFVGEVTAAFVMHRAWIVRLHEATT